MDTSAVVMMVVGMVVIWGGLTASIIHAVKKSKSKS
ncbi:methionine/alanine import family NSS transporter small subunit [Bacillus sp. B15-48]|nr:methionine/alanine import family NSS transporter small subunit [Bacillus sp. B15-48]MBM4760746.1 methionine/alanine import family NSS transporter small subunit [Bacillus sp. B15-48]